MRELAREVGRGATDNLKLKVVDLGMRSLSREPIYDALTHISANRVACDLQDRETRLSRVRMSRRSTYRDDRRGATRGLGKPFSRRLQRCGGSNHAGVLTRCR